MDSWLCLVTAFLHEWLIIPPDYLLPSGYVRPDRIGACIGYLMGQGVFDGAGEISMELMREYGVILPEWYYQDAVRMSRDGAGDEKSGSPG